MKFSNFKIIEIKPRLILTEFRAEVDVTTGFWWWKKTVTRSLWRRTGDGYRFADTGELIDGSSWLELKNAIKIWLALTGGEA